MSISLFDPTREDIFSITFIDPENEVIKKNTWSNWHLVPTSRPLVNPPKPKTNYVEIPGADGALDYTEALSSTVHFGSREGTWEFYVAIHALEYSEIGFDGWYELYNDILNFLNGKKLKFTLDSEDNKYIWTGRFTLDSWDSSDKFTKIVIGYVLTDKEGGINGIPNGSTALYDWKWNELFTNFKKVPYDTIYYGSFDVDGTIYRNLYNPNSENVNVNIKNTSAMTMCTVSVDETTNPYTFSNEGSPISLAESGTRSTTLAPGNNYFKFTGHGAVTVDYITGEQS